MRYLFVLILLSKLFLVQENPVDILKKVQSKYADATDFSVELTQFVNSSNPIKGKLFIKQKDFYRIELPNQIIISDGKTFWNYNKKQNKVIVDNFQKSNDNIFSFNYLLFEVPYNSNISLSSQNGLKKLILNPKDVSFPFRKIEILINYNFLVKRVNAVDNSGVAFEINFDNYRFNQNLKSELFVFNPAEGTKVIDLR